MGACCVCPYMSYVLHTHICNQIKSLEDRGGTDLYFSSNSFLIHICVTYLINTFTMKIKAKERKRNVQRIFFFLKKSNQKNRRKFKIAWHRGNQGKTISRMESPTVPNDITISGII